MKNKPLKVYKLRAGFLLFDCGEKSNKFNRLKEANSNRTRICTKCGALAIAKIFKCKTCRKEFQKGLRGKGTEYCSDECRPWMKYTYDETSEIEVKPQKNRDTISSVSAPPRKTDCKYYLKRCLSLPHGRLMKNPKACIKCTDYALETRGSVLDHVKEVIGSISQMESPSNAQYS